MTNNTNLVDEILSSIDEMDSITMESSLDVMNSLLDSYDKILTIQENYEGDVDDFETIMESFYQEGEIMDEVKEKNKDRNIFMKILMFIPTLLQAIWHSIKKAWDGGKAAKTASSAADKVKGMASDAKDFLSKLISVDEDNKGKIIGLTIAGVTVTAAGVAAFIAAKKGVFEKLFTSFKTFWDEKTKQFFVKAIAPEDIPESAKDVCLVYTNTTDKWSTFLNLDAVIKFFTEPKDVIDNIGRISNISDEKSVMKVYNDYKQKLDNVCKLKIFSKNRFEYTTDQMVKFFKDIDAVVGNMISGSEKAWTAVNTLVKNSKNQKDVNKKSIKMLEEVAKSLGLYAGVAPKLSAFVNSFNASYTEILKFEEEYKEKMAKIAAEGESASTDSGEAASSTTNETSATESKEPEQESTGDGKVTSGSEEEKSNGTPEASVQSEIESKEQEVLDEYKQWRDKNPNATKQERNAMRNKIAMAKGFSKNQAKKIVVEFTTLYGTLEFGDNVYQESMIDECYDIDTTDVTSNGWYSR